VLLVYSFAVPHVSAALRYYDQAVVSKSATRTGTYATVGSVPLFANAFSYEVVDPDGNPDYWYRYQLRNSTSGAVATASSPTLGVDPALDVLSVEEFKTSMLFGVELTDGAGNPYPEWFFEFYIKSAVTHLENSLGVAIRPQTIENEQHDFVPPEFFRFIFTQTDYAPIRDITAARLVLPSSSNPNGETVTEFPLSWVIADKNAGHIQLLPAQGAAANIILLGQGASWLPMIYGSFDYVPSLIRLSYTAGFERRETPSDLRMAVALLASVGPLNTAGDLVIGPGVASQSLSIDNISQNIQTTASAENTAYSARANANLKLLKDMIPNLRLAYRGVGLHSA
jgi:hypothetical protein